MSQAFEKSKRYLGNRKARPTEEKRIKKEERIATYLGSQIATYKVAACDRIGFRKLFCFLEKNTNINNQLNMIFTHETKQKRQIKNLTRLLAG